MSDRFVRVKNISDNYTKKNEHLISFVEELLLTGKPTDAIKNHFYIRYPKQRSGTFTTIHSLAKERISNKYPSNVNVVFRQHYTRYNLEIEKHFIRNVNPDDFTGKERIDVINALINSYFLLMDVTNQKEEFLGFHKKQLIVNIKNTIIHKRKHINLGKKLETKNKLKNDNEQLTNEEKIRFLHLLEKIEISSESIIAKNTEMQISKEVQIEIIEPLPIHQTNAEYIIVDNMPDENKIEKERPKKLEEIMKKIKDRNLKNN
jgi:hypothetical protein